MHGFLPGFHGITPANQIILPAWQMEIQLHPWPAWHLPFENGALISTSSVPLSGVRAQLPIRPPDTPGDEKGRAKCPLALPLTTLSPLPPGGAGWLEAKLSTRSPLRPLQGMGFWGADSPCFTRLVQSHWWWGGEEPQLTVGPHLSLSLWGIRSPPASSRSWRISSPLSPQ